MTSVTMQLEQPVTVVEDIPVTLENSSTKTSKWAVVKAAQHRILPQQSKGEGKLSNLIDELQKFTIENDAPKIEPISKNTRFYSLQIFRQHLAQFVQSPTFHYIVISLVISDLIIVLIDLILAQLSAPCLTAKEMEEYNTTIQRDTCLLDHSSSLAQGETFLFIISLFLLTIFVFEVFLCMFAYDLKYFTYPLYVLDGCVVFASFILEIYFHFGDIGRAGRAASAIVILRLWKVIRAIHAIVHSITLKNQLLIKKIQEAKILLEDEKEQVEEMLEKQEIKVDYLVSLLTKMGQLPSTTEINKHVDQMWTQKKPPI